jgi:hypothetical protein
MIQRLLFAAVATTMLTGSVLAAGPGPNVCSSPQFQKFLKTRIGWLEGAHAHGYFPVQQMDSVVTITATPDTIVCQVTAEMAGHGRPVQGVFTQTRLPNGKFKFKWVSHS